MSACHGCQNVLKLLNFYFHFKFTINIVVDIIVDVANAVIVNAYAVIDAVVVVAAVVVAGNSMELSNHTLSITSITHFQGTSACGRI